MEKEQSIQSYEEAVIKTVLWWSEKAFNTPLNQNNGDNSSSGAMAFMLMNTAANFAKETITPDKIKKFEQKLTELLMSAESGSTYDRSLSVDYSPCEKLYEACLFAGIDTLCLPCKSHSCIEKDNRAMAKYQYGGSYISL